MAKVRPNKIDFVANPQLSNGSMVNLDEGLDNLDTKVDDYIGEIKDFIVESGSNANGSWKKWASGDLEMTVNKLVNLNTNAFQKFNLPQPVINENYSVIPTLSANPTSGVNADWYNNLANIAGASSSLTEGALLYRGTGSNTSGMANIKIFGRWKV